MALSLGVMGCYAPERDCQAFRNGTFTFTSEINGETKTTTFVRENDLEVDYFDGEADSASVHWINNCEYVVRKLHPRNASEEKAIHIKILTTSDNAYTFEYGLVGSPEKSKGTANKSK